MPIGAADTLLERRGIGGIGQHLTIVIAFEHQGVTASQRLYKMGCGLVCFGLFSLLHVSIGSLILNRFARIVRHGKRHQRQVADRQTVAVAAKMQGDAAAIGSQRLVSAIGEPYRDAVPAREFDYAADVILMIMRDHDAREICRRLPSLARRRSVSRRPKPQSSMTVVPVKPEMVDISSALPSLPLPRLANFNDKLLQQLPAQTDGKYQDRKSGSKIGMII